MHFILMQWYICSIEKLGLSRASGRKTEKFTVSVNIASSSEVVFELAFEELLKRRFGYYEMFIKVNPKQIVKNFEVKYF